MSQQVFKTKADMVCPILALPVEIGRQVIQNLDSIAELHALSLSCKAFKEITRERIFAHITFTLPFPSKFCRATEWAQETRLRGLSKMVVQTKYIQTLSVLPQSPVEPNEVTFPPNMQEILAEWMRRMTKLGKLVIENVNLSEQLILTILDITSQQPLSLQLRRCPFSGPLLQMPSIPLHIPTLDIQGYSDSVYWDRPIDVYTPIEEQSIAVAGRLLVRAQLSITALRVDWNSPLSLIEMLGGIFLPSLRAFHWNFLLYVDEQLSTVMDGFLQRHPTIISISLAGEEYSHIPFSFPSLSLVSPSLPNLEIVKTTSNFIHQLVPGRPVTSICVTCVEPSGFTTAVQYLSLSTATITKASLIFSEGSESWEHVIESLAEATPSLQELNLRTTSPSFGPDVRTHR